MVKEEVIVKQTVEEVTKELASLVEKEANEAIQSRGKFVIGLSGKDTASIFHYAHILLILCVLYCCFHYALCNFL